MFLYYGLRDLRLQLGIPYKYKKRISYHKKTSYTHTYYAHTCNNKKTKYIEYIYYYFL